VIDWLFMGALRASGVSALEAGIFWLQRISAVAGQRLRQAGQQDHAERPCDEADEDEACASWRRGWPGPVPRACSDSRPALAI